MLFITVKNQSFLNALKSAPSIVNKFSFIKTPPAPLNPVKAPVDASTRWQGIMTGIGLAAKAPPTARAAFGDPTLFAS